MFLSNLFRKSIIESNQNNNTISNEKQCDEEELIQNEQQELNDFDLIILNSKEIEIESNGNYFIRYGKIKKLIPIITKSWDYQREISQDHVNKLMISIRSKNHLHGIISLCSINNKIYIVDGQHRMAALRLLIEKDLIHDIDLIIEITKCLNHKEALQYFETINLSTPLDRNVILGETQIDYFEKIREKMVEMYPTIFRESNSPIPPYMNFSKLKDKIVELELNKILTIEQFIEQIDSQNEDAKIIMNKKYELCRIKLKDIKISSKDRNIYVKIAKIIENMRKIKCYLHDDSTYNWLEKFI
jgi:hypothetical protein